jgi:pectin methylesterase-like acyl-CoA thioesterase
MGCRPAALAAVITTLSLPAVAAAQDPPAPSYPEPSNPGTVAPRPAGKGKTRTVCRRGCDFRHIQAAVNAARAGDTIRVRNGVCRESVRVQGRKKSYLRLVATRAHPARSCSTAAAASPTASS